MALTSHLHVAEAVVAQKRAAFDESVRRIDEAWDAYCHEIAQWPLIDAALREAEAEVRELRRAAAMRSEERCA